METRDQAVAHKASSGASEKLKGFGSLLESRLRLECSDKLDFLPQMASPCEQVCMLGHC